MKKDYLANKEYRYGCSIDCGGTPLRVYVRDLGSQGGWNSVEDYLPMLYGTLYHNSLGSFSDYRLPSGHWLSDMGSTEVGYFICRDSFGATPVLVELDIPAPLYLGQDEATITGEYAPAVLKAVIIGGLIIIGATIVTLKTCLDTANRTKQELDNWDHRHSGTDKGGDKLVHCVTACLIGLRHSPGCAELAAGSTERGGVPWGDPPTDRDSILDEKANFEGVNCARQIRPRGDLISIPPPPKWVTGNDWLDCQWCCHQKGYRRWH